jgi:hypothetical protein
MYTPADTPNTPLAGHSIKIATVWERLRNLDAMGCVGEKVVTRTSDYKAIEQVLGHYELNHFTYDDGRMTYHVMDEEIGDMVLKGEGPYIIAVAEIIALAFGPEFLTV